MLPGDSPQRLMPRPPIKYAQEEPLVGVDLGQLAAVLRGELDVSKLVICPSSPYPSMSALVLSEMDSNGDRTLTIEEWDHKHGRTLDHGNGEGKSKVPYVSLQKKFDPSETGAALEAIHDKSFPSVAPEEPRAGSDQAESGGDEGNAVLVEYLSKHPDAAEDDALPAVNAALPAAAKRWTLNKLRKHKDWREHVERRIGDCLDANPHASLERIGEKVGYVKSTVSDSKAYQDRKDKRKGEKRPSTTKRGGNLTEEQLACLPTGKQLPRSPERDALHADSYTADGNTLTDPNAFRSLLLNLFDDDSSNRGKVNKLTDRQLAELQQHVKDNLRPDDTELLRLTVEQWLDDRS